VRTRVMIRQVTKSICHDNTYKINRQHIYKSSRSTATHNHAHKGNDEERTQDIEGQVSRIMK
jgi:hypothetical protein